MPSTALGHGGGSHIAGMEHAGTMNFLGLFCAPWPLNIPCGYLQPDMWPNSLQHVEMLYPADFQHVGEEVCLEGRREGGSCSGGGRQLLRHGNLRYHHLPP